MRALLFGRYTALTAIAAMLPGCGGLQPAMTPGSAASHRASTGSKTFNFTGAAQMFTVPGGVTHVTLTAIGAGCPSEHKGPSGPSSIGSNGGFLKATIPVTPREKLVIFVGGRGAFGVGGNAGGGFNGGGAGGKGIYQGPSGDWGFGGGGASDVRQGGDRLEDRVLVAGGGGGGGVAFGFYGAGAGGAGGGIVGGTGGGACCGNPSGEGGQGGSQTAGGKGGLGGLRSGYHAGENGAPGKRGTGGAGGGGTPYSGGGGGGAGGGYYGGGGGGAGSFATSGVGGGGGGGGGSSFVEPSAKNVKNVQGGGTSGNGKIVISW